MVGRHLRARASASTTELGGLTTYAAIQRTHPDLFLHCGDTIYADLEIPVSFEEESGHVWHNVVSDGVEKVSETLAEFRGRQRYVLQDRNVQALYADVPTVVQWDDHETCNNWYPGEILDDDRYTERRCDVLAARGRRAWQEYQPVPVSTFIDRDGDGFASGRIYRKVPRGQHLDLFFSTCAPTGVPTTPSTPRSKGSSGRTRRSG